MSDQEPDLLYGSESFQTSLIDNEKFQNISFRKAMRQAGKYYLGTIEPSSMGGSVKQCLAKKVGSDKHYMMKILILDTSESMNICSFQSRSLFHNEYSLLALLRGVPGVIALHEFFKDYLDIKSDDGGKHWKLKRLCMVLECLMPHKNCNNEYVLLSQYIKETKLKEREVLHIYYNILSVLQELHKRNIGHGDLKLSGIILNKKTLKVKFINFHQSKLLSLEPDPENPYKSPPNLTSEHNLAKSYDMWSSGIILLSLLNACFNFTGLFSPSTQLLLEYYWKYKEDENSYIKFFSEGTRSLAEKIIYQMPEMRIKVNEALTMVSDLIKVCDEESNKNSRSECCDQVVPECPDFDCKDELDSNSEAVKSIQSDKVEEAEMDSDSTDTNSVPLDTENPNQLPNDTDETRQVPDQYMNCSSDIKAAMKRLGATSVNNVTALSFDYSRSSR